MKIWNILRLVFLNVLVIDSLRNLPIIGHLGSNLFALYLITALIFLIPVAYISRRIAEVGVGSGGASIYQFTEMELGRKAAFVQEILLWSYNALWYPTLILFLGHFAFPILHWSANANHLALWLLIPMMLLSSLPVRFSSTLSSVMALFGAILPMSVLAIYAFIHIHSQTAPASSYFLPHLSTIKLDYVPTVFFSLMGIELATMHSDVLFSKKQEWNIALWISIPIIIFLLVGCGLAVWELGEGQFLRSLTTTLLKIFSFLPHTVAAVIVLLVSISVLSQAIFWMQATARGITKATTKTTHPLKVRVAIFIQTLVTLFIMLGILSSKRFNHDFLYISNISVLLAIFYYAILMASYIKYCKQNRKGLFWALTGLLGLLVLLVTTILTL